jgi:starch synthase
MNVLFASAEAVPFAKAGGLADVVGALPKYLRKQGVDARVIMPLYGMIDRAAYRVETVATFQFSRHQGTADVRLSYTEYDGVPFYFVATWPFFGEGGHLYTQWEWDVPRFIAFNELILSVAYQLGVGAGGRAPWFPDVLHLHDWHTGLAPFLVAYGRRDQWWAKMGTVITIHNMGYQGPHASPFLFQAGIPPREMLESFDPGKGDNLLAIGLGYSDMITAVSPRYATEIQYPRFGEGLEGLVGRRAYFGDVVGILNGLDTERWNPATDRALMHHFDVDTFTQLRHRNKIALQSQMALPVRPDVPMIGIVSRLTEQKGFDLAIPALSQLLSEQDIQVMALGSGEPALENSLWALENNFRDKARSYVGFEPTLAQRIYASCDLFLMPSRYEPCGTGQMMALRYGALPVVRETGGLADTVQSYDDGPADYGTGFVFLWEQPDAVLNTLRWALDTYRQRPEAFRRMQRRGMEIDFGWERSAREYIRVYERALAKH